MLAGPAQRSALTAQREGSVSLSILHKCWLWDINLTIIWEVPSGFTAKRAGHLEVTLGPIVSSEKKASFPVYGYIWVPARNQVSLSSFCGGGPL